MTTTTTWCSASSEPGCETGETRATSPSATILFTYDANLASKSSGWTYEWNHQNLPSRALLNGGQQQAYHYDALGRRVKVDGTSGSSWTVSLFSGMDVVYEVDQAGEKTKYVRADRATVVMMMSGRRPGRLK